MGGARLVARVPHTHLVPKGHGLVRVLRCDVRHNVLQERGLLRLGEENERHRTLFRKPDYRDVIFLDVRNNLTAALRSSRKSSSARPGGEPASGGLRALRSTEALPVLILELMPRCASCLAYTSAASAPMCSAACFVCATVWRATVWRARCHLTAVGCCRWYRAARARLPP